MILQPPGFSFVDDFIRSVAWHVSRDQISIREVIERISLVDWEALIREELENRISYLVEQNEKVHKCNRCQQDTKLKDLIYFSSSSYSTALPFGAGYGYYCRECFPSVEKELFQKYQRTCLICETVFFVNRFDVKHPLCDEHNTSENRHEVVRVASQNSRTKALGLVSDLNPAEWLEIVRKHNNKCVYCGGEWSDMDHVIPVSAGGGTTKDNVVPACRTCNSKKSNNVMFTELVTA